MKYNPHSCFVYPEQQSFMVLLLPVYQYKVNKNKTVYARHRGMTKNNSPIIKTKGLRIKELFKLNSDEFKKKEESRVGSRIKKISFINELLIEFSKKKKKFPLNSIMISKEVNILKKLLQRKNIMSQGLRKKF